MLRANTESYNLYQILLDQGVARETAREVLNLNIYTKFIWKMDLHNLMHFMNLRLDPHAQKEIREYAEIIEKLVALFFPLSYEAFVDYVRDAYTCSRMEVGILRAMIADFTEIGVSEEAVRLATIAYYNKLGMGNREVADFMKRFFE